MPNNIMIELWHHDSDWSVTKRDDQYWHKVKDDTEWKCSVGSSPYVKLQFAWSGSKPRSRN
jgi:hypothetical protein